MNWDAIGAVGEVVGAICVVLTLGYLAVQIRQNTRATRATTYSSTTGGWHDDLQSEYLDPTFRAYMQPIVDTASRETQPNVRALFTELMIKENDQHQQTHAGRTAAS